MTHELQIDPTTRLFAANNGGLTLDVWAALKSAVFLAQFVGVELVLPGPTPVADKPRRVEVAKAKRLLDDHSIIKGLPVI